jgi:hypothetical protein
MLILSQSKELTVSNLPLKVEEFIWNLRGVDDVDRESLLGIYKRILVSGLSWAPTTSLRLAIPVFHLLFAYQTILYVPAVLFLA